MHFKITEQVTIEGFAELSVLVKNGRVYADLSDENRPQMLFERNELNDLGILGGARSVCVGSLNNRAVGLVSLEEHRLESIADDDLVGLRRLLFEFPGHITQVAARAAQLDTWLSTHKYCGRCGTPTDLADFDRALVCPNCGNRMYPKLAPCVIGIIIKGDKILLAQGVRHPENIYSALAGFVEVGESAEEAFIREVDEEVGIKIKNPEYIRSQNWPFPHQLMLGFIAEYESGEINIDKQEIIHAGWFKKTELPSLPGHFTIARSVIDEALNRI